MVTLLLDSAHLEVALSGSERLLAFRRQNVDLPRDTIAKVQLTDDVWTWLRGVPSPGTHVRGVVAMGTWKSAGSEDFVLVRGRRPGVALGTGGGTPPVVCTGGGIRRHSRGGTGRRRCSTGGGVRRYGFAGTNRQHSTASTGTGGTTHRTHA